MAAGSHRPSRPLEWGRAAWGASLLVAPRAVLSGLQDVEVDRTSLVVTRILGARHLTQAVLSGVRPSPEVLAMGTWVDGAHAVTALALAASDRQRAPAGLIDTGVAAVWAAAGFRDLGSADGTPPGHQRRRDRMARAVLGVIPGGRPLLRRVDDDRRASAR